MTLAEARDLGWAPPGDRSNRVSRRAWAAVALAAVLVSACGGEASLDEWSAGWQDARAGIPPLRVLLAEGHEEVCSTALGDVRRWVGELETAPNRDLARAFLDWAEFAEAVFLECPLRSGSHAGFEASYEELHRLASEVDALVEFERGLDEP